MRFLNLICLCVLTVSAFSAGCAAGNPNGPGSSIRWGPRVLNRYPGTYVDHWRVNGGTPKVIRYMDSGVPTDKVEFNREIAIDAAGYVWGGRLQYTITGNICDERTGEILYAIDLEVRITKRRSGRSYGTTGIGVSPENDLTFTITRDRIESSGTSEVSGRGEMKRIAPVVTEERYRPVDPGLRGDGSSDGMMRGPKEIIRTPDGRTRVRWE